MKKQYTKKQITEAIAYWKKQLKMMNESATAGSKLYQVVWKFSNAADNPELKLYTSKDLAKEYAESKMNYDDDSEDYEADKWYMIREYTVVK